MTVSCAWAILLFMSNDTEIKYKHMHVKLPEELHRKVKMLCVLRGRTLGDYALEALVEKIGVDEASLRE